MSLFIVTGGFLCIVHGSVRPVLVAQVGAGVAILFALPTGIRFPITGAWLRRRLVVAMGRAGLIAILAGSCALAVLAFCASLGNHWFNPSDDLPLYFVLAEKLVQRGIL